MHAFVVLYQLYKLECAHMVRNVTRCINLRSLNQSIEAQFKFIAAQRTRSSLWQEGGTGSRIFGDDVAGSAVSSRSSQYSTSASSSREGRKKNNQIHKGRRRNAFDDNDDKEDDQPLAAMQALSI